MAGHAGYTSSSPNWVFEPVRYLPLARLQKPLRPVGHIGVLLGQRPYIGHKHYEVGAAEADDSQPQLLRPSLLRQSNASRAT